MDWLHLLPKIDVRQGPGSPQGKMAHKIPGVQRAKGKRRIPQEVVIQARLWHQEGLSIDQISILTGIGRAYLYNLVVNGLRDQERESLRPKD